MLGSARSTYHKLNNNDFNERMLTERRAMPRTTPQSASEDIATLPLLGGSYASAVIYLRVSSLKQTQKAFDPEGYSIPIQRDGCTQYAGRQGASVVAEFVDYGESARTANRPQLQVMLRYIAENPVDYVIFYDVSRLARNELDAFQLLDAIETVGAQVGSATENIDTRTTAGRLVFGVLASTHAHRSRGDGEKVQAGLHRKHEMGGTPGVAPLGYLNTVAMVDGHGVRTVILDAERAPHVKLAFDLYASGTYTISSLTERLEEVGLRTVPRGSRLSRPVTRSYVHRMLGNPYYVGIVEYAGVRHPGRHEPLVDQATFDTVQTLLAANALSGDRSHKHMHYLKGSVFCGLCGARLSYGRHRSKTGTHYEYFGCVARNRPRGACRSSYIPVEDTERAVQRYWVSVRFSAAQRARIRVAVHEFIDARREVAVEETQRKRQALKRLQDQHRKLLQLYYDDAVDKALLKSEQQRIDREKADIAIALEAASADVTEIGAALDEALALTEDADSVYAAANATERRLLNQAVFERLVIEQEWVIDGPKVPLYAELEKLDRHLARTENQAGRPKELKNPGPTWDRGSNEYLMVRMRGLEPPRGNCPTRPSTLRVYQFRHIRVTGASQHSERVALTTSA
jgi:site-specific DNA recombinase